MRLAEIALQRSRYARCQIIDAAAHAQEHRYVDGVWAGGPADFEIHIGQLSVELVLRAYTKALAEAEKRFPGFTDCTFADGPDVGERRIVFPHNRQDMAAVFMWNRISEIVESGEIQLAERFSIRSWEPSWPDETGSNYLVDVLLDRPAIDEATWQEVCGVVAGGDPFPVDTEPRTCDVGVIQRMITELSFPELVLINWDMARKPLRPVDRALLRAARRCDPDEVAAVLAQGADANATTEFAETPALNVVTYEPWTGPEPRQGRDPLDRETRPSLSSLDRRIACLEALFAGGAHIDYADPFGPTLLERAAHIYDADMVEYLLDKGADDSLAGDLEDTAGTSPSAWSLAFTDREFARIRAMDFASLGTDEERTENARRVRELFRARRWAPDGTPPGDVRYREARNNVP